MTNDPVPAGCIEVARCSDGRWLQLSTIMASQPINFPATFTTSGVNFDGYLDFSVLRNSAQHSGLNRGASTIP
jgi:hypothetical protein